MSPSSPPHLTFHENLCNFLFQFQFFIYNFLFQFLIFNFLLFKLEFFRIFFSPSPIPTLPLLPRFLPSPSIPYIICYSPDRRLQVPFFFLLSLLLYSSPTNPTRLLVFTTQRTISILWASLRSRSTFHPNPGV